MEFINIEFVSVVFVNNFVNRHFSLSANIELTYQFLSHYSFSYEVIT